MQTEALKKIVLDIKALKTETQTIELKAAIQGCPTRLFQLSTTHERFSQL